MRTQNSFSFFFSRLFISLIKLRRFRFFYSSAVRTWWTNIVLHNPLFILKEKIVKVQQQQKNTLLGGFKPPTFRITVNYLKIILYFDCTFLLFVFSLYTIKLNEF